MSEHRRHRSSSHRRHRRRRRSEDEDDEEMEDRAPRAAGRGDGLVKQTKACDEQWYINMVDYLGQVTTEDRAMCWLCRAARHDSAMIPMEAWNKMAEIYKKGQLETDPVVNAWNLSMHFETKIRQVANSHLKRHQPPIPELRAVDLYWHFRMHVFEASNEIFQTIQDIKAVERDLLGSARKAIIKADGRPSFAIRKKYIEPLNKVWTQKRQYLAMRPERSYFFNPVYGLNVSDVAVFANKNRNFVQANVEDYLAKESAKRIRVDTGAAQPKVPAVALLGHSSAALLEMAAAVPYLHAIPGDNSIPRPFDRAIPTNGMGHVQTFARNPVMADMSTAQNNYHLASSEWTTTVRVSMTRWDDHDLHYEDYVSPGDLVFVHAGKEKPVAAFDSEEMHVLNVQCFQDIMKRLYSGAMQRIAPYINEEDPRSDNGDADRLGTYGKFLGLPETSMLSLFEPGSEFGAKMDAAWIMRFLCIHGITDSFRPLGVVMTDPSVVYDASRRVRSPNMLKAGRKDISVATSGTVDMYNYWPGAQQLDYLFMVVTRKFSPEKNGYDTFHAKFVYSPTKELSPHGQMYFGLNDLPERSAIYYIGQKTDDKGVHPDETTTPLVQGLRGTLGESVNAMRQFQKIRVLLAPVIRRT